MESIILLNNSALYSYLLLPLLIFLARICDVTIGTIRIVMVAKGQKFWAPILGFFEVLIWLLAITRIIQNMENWLCYFAYGFGFATGNYIGLKLEEKLALGIAKIQIITMTDASNLIASLKDSGFGVTYQDAYGTSQSVSVIHSIIKRSEISKFESIINQHVPNAFYSVEDVKYVSKNIPQVKRVFSRWKIGK
jgi:uncharacterized protein YebE (UPF0316 family)